MYGEPHDTPTIIEKLRYEVLHQDPEESKEENKFDTVDDKVLSSIQLKSEAYSPIKMDIPTNSFKVTGSFGGGKKKGSPKNLSPGKSDLQTSARRNDVMRKSNQTVPGARWVGTFSTLK